MDELTNITGVARKLHVSRQWLEREVAGGRIPFLQAGRRRLFNLSAVQAALAARAMQTPPAIGERGAKV